MEVFSPQIFIAFGFGVVFVVVTIVIAVAFPHPTPFQYNVFRIVLALAAAGVAAMVPGFIDIKISSTTGLLIRAGGALAIFVIAYFFNPAQLAIQREINPDRSLPPPPIRLPDGQPFPLDQREAFKRVWRSLAALDFTGRALWREVSSRSLSDFADSLREAEECVGEHALFFSRGDYKKISELLEAADFYFGGKASLRIMYDRQLNSDTTIDLNVENEIRDQIKHNKQWLTEYQKLLAEIRSSLYEQVAV